MSLTDPAFDDVLIVDAAIPLATLQKIAESGFGDMVKAVVDIERRMIAVGGDLHSDGEAALLDRGSRQADLWGINLYPELYGAEGWIEFDSLINIRPRRGNRSRGVEDAGTQRVIADLVGELVSPRV